MFNNSYNDNSAIYFIYLSHLQKSNIIQLSPSSMRKTVVAKHTLFCGVYRIEIRHFLFLFFLFFKLVFTPCKAEQPLIQGMELQEKEAQKKLSHTTNLFRKNLHLIGVY